MGLSGIAKRRGLKRYYRNLWRRVTTFALDSGEADWYDQWHMHVDSCYVSRINANHRREHIKLLFALYENCAAQMQSYPHSYQLWIYWDGADERSSAVYIHTDNPNFKRSKNAGAFFPLQMKDVEWNCAVPNLLALLFRANEMIIGKYTTSSNAYIVTARISDFI